MTRLVVLLMPWGRVGSNLINGVVTRSKAIKVWNEPLTGVQTRVLAAGKSITEVWPEQKKWIAENIEGSDQRIFLNVAANSVGNASEFRMLMDKFDPEYLILDRTDDLATALSALRTESWVKEGQYLGETRSWSIPSGTSVSFRPSIEPKRVEFALSIIEKGRRNIQTIISEKDSTLYLYEDLCTNMEKVVTDILVRSGIPPYNFQVKSGKFGSGILSDLISNSREIAQLAQNLKVKTTIELE